MMDNDKISVVGCGEFNAVGLGVKEGDTAVSLALTLDEAEALVLALQAASILARQADAQWNFVVPPGATGMDMACWIQDAITASEALDLEAAARQVH